MAKRKVSTRVTQIDVTPGVVSGLASRLIRTGATHAVGGLMIGLASGMGHHMVVTIRNKAVRNILAAAALLSYGSMIVHSVLLFGKRNEHSSGARLFFSGYLFFDDKTFKPSAKPTWDRFGYSFLASRRPRSRSS